VRILISADMEGITGVTNLLDTTPRTPGWERFRPIMTRDANAAIAGAFDGGATEVIVVEAHYGHRNILIEELDERAKLLTGRHKRFGMLEGIDRGIDLVFLVGYHAPAGTAGTLSHTFFAAALTELRLNGETCSETRMMATLAGEFGAGVGIVTGDDVAAADAAKYIPGVKTVIVKEATDRFTAICLPPKRTEKLIRAAAAEAVSSPAAHPPLRIQPPFVWDARWVSTASAKAASHVPGVELVDPHSLHWVCPDMKTSHDIFTIVAALAGGAIEERFV